jgi:hypothetical protein
MADEDSRRDDGPVPAARKEEPGDPEWPGTHSHSLASRFQQMFPVLSSPEVDRIRRFGDIRRFPDGTPVLRKGERSSGMLVILSGRVAIDPRDALGREVPVEKFAELIGAPLEEMKEVVPGEVMAEIGDLTGRPSPSVLDARAVGDVDAIVVSSDALRALLVEEAEIGERILRALILRRVALIDLGFGGPVLIGAPRSPDVTRLSGFLERNGIPFRVVDPEHDPEAASLLARFASAPQELPVAVLSDGTMLRNPSKQEFARALGLVAASFRAGPYDVAVVGAGPAGLATAVYGASEGLSVVVLEALAFGGQAGASARIENYLGFPTGVSGQSLMGRAYTQALKFGAEFSLSTEVTRLDCATGIPDPDPAHVLELADGRRLRARTIVVATGARYRRPEIPRLAEFEGRGVSYWASPVEGRSADTKTWPSSAAETPRVRRRSFSRATRATCVSWCADRGSRARCRATSSTASRLRPTSRSSATPRSRRSSGAPIWDSRACAGATGAPAPRRSTPCPTSSSSRGPTPRRAGSPAAEFRSTRRASSEPVSTWARPSGCPCLSRPGSRGSSPSATSAAAR